LGTFGYFYINERESVYQFSSNEISKTTNEARLILSDGEEVALKKDNSSVALNKDNQLVINRDSIIDLNPKVLNAEDENQMNEAVIPYGKRLELQLTDGTKVWLNAGSKLAFPSKFNKKNREVYLEGEACFKVAKNEKQPFIVKAGKLDIKVLGTFFDVSAYPVDGTIETVLLEGSVAVKKPGLIGLSKTEVILKPNQRANFNKENQEFKISDDPNASVSVAWIEGWLQFSSENLQSVFTKLERYYNIEIQASGNFASTQYITGKLDLKDSLELVMKALGDVAKLNYRINDNKVYIDKKMDELQRK